MTKARLLEKGDILNNSDLANWFGVSEKTIQAARKDKLKELEDFCSFIDFKGSGNILIKEVYYPVYTNRLFALKKAIEEEVKKTHYKGALISYKKIAADYGEGCELLARKISLDYYEGREFVPCRFDTVNYLLEPLDKEMVMKFVMDIGLIYIREPEGAEEKVKRLLKESKRIKKEYGNNWIYEGGYILK